MGNNGHNYIKVYIFRIRKGKGIQISNFHNYRLKKKVTLKQKCGHNLTSGMSNEFFLKMDKMEALALAIKLNNKKFV